MVRKLLALVALSALVTSGAALASAPAAPKVTASVDAPVVVAPEVPSNAKVGVLKDDADCGGVGFSKVIVPLSKQGFLCIHSAADIFPSTAEALKQAHPAAASKGPATAPVPCYGDGTTGARIQLVYGYYDGTPNRSKQIVAEIRTLMAPRMQAVIKNQSLGRDLGMRFLFTKGCKAIDVLVVKFPRSVQGSNPRDVGGQLGRAANVLYAMGHHRSDRKYHILWDGWTNGGACGVGFLFTFGTSSQPYSTMNQGFPTVGARTDPDPTKSGTASILTSSYSLTWGHVGSPNGPSCFGRGQSTITVQMHEILHTLGAVQLDAPNADTGHCRDAPSVMCSGGAEGYGQGTQIAACARVLVETLDCGMNDYWSPNPILTEYLGTHYNVARSPFFGPQPQDSLAPSPV